MLLPALSLRTYLERWSAASHCRRSSSSNSYFLSTPHRCSPDFSRWVTRSAFSSDGTGRAPFFVPFGAGVYSSSPFRCLIRASAYSDRKLPRRAPGEAPLGRVAST